jgi:hypothetical protein
MDPIDQAIEETERLLLQAKSAEVKKSLRRTYFELLKKKFGDTKDEEDKGSKKDEEDKGPLPCPAQVKETEGPVKLHALRKFKIDHDTIQEIFQNKKAEFMSFFISLAKFLPDYFGNNKEFMTYIKNSCYAGLRVKDIFSKEHEEQVEEYIIPHNKKRRYLAQHVDDLTNIMIDQAPIIEGNIAEFIRNGSGYVVTGIKSVKLEVTPFKPGIRKARGYIPLYPWLQRRRGIVNIRNKDNRCFWKCLYRALVPDKHRNYSRDVRRNSYRNLWTNTTLIPRYSRTATQQRP